MEVACERGEEEAEMTCRQHEEDDAHAEEDEDAEDTHAEVEAEGWWCVEGEVVRWRGCGTRES